MPEIIPATIELFDTLLPLLKRFETPEMDKQAWRALFSTHWSDRYRHKGWVMMQGTEAVGFLGGLFHDRKIRGEIHCLCNLFCWYVCEEYRPQSLLLLLSALKKENLTITSLTPSEQASRILRQFKFQTLDKEVVILPYVPMPRCRQDWAISTDRNIIGKILPQAHRHLLDDHPAPWCHHLVTWNNRDPEELCHVVFNRVIKRNIPFTQVYYTSSAALFKKHLRRIQGLFFRINRTPLTVIDRRLLPGTVPFGGIRYELRYPRLFRSMTLAPVHIDNLYSELLFLKKI